jgi:hypothetical protein
VFLRSADRDPVAGQAKAVNAHTARSRPPALRGRTAGALAGAAGTRAAARRRRTSAAATRPVARGRRRRQRMCGRQGDAWNGRRLRHRRRLGHGRRLRHGRHRDCRHRHSRNGHCRHGDRGWRKRRQAARSRGCDPTGHQGRDAEGERKPSTPQQGSHYGYNAWRAVGDSAFVNLTFLLGGNGGYVRQIPPSAKTCGVPADVAKLRHVERRTAGVRFELTGP